MNEWNNRIAFASILLIAAFALGQRLPQPEGDLILATATAPKPSPTAVLPTERTLRLTITVDDPSYLKVVVGQEIKQGQILSDNTIERDRLLRQRKSIELQVENLKSTPIPKPTIPIAPPPILPLPPENVTEQEAAIAQAELKLQQARQLYESRFSDLSSDEPEAKAIVNKATSALQSASEPIRFG